MGEGRHGDGRGGIELGAGLRRSQPVNTADPGLRNWKCHVLQGSHPEGLFISAEAKSACELENRTSI